MVSANWSDKATNIKAIAEELSLGLDAIVLSMTIRLNALWCNEHYRRSKCRSCRGPAYYAKTLSAAGY